MSTLNQLENTVSVVVQAVLFEKKGRGFFRKQSTNEDYGFSCWQPFPGHYKVFHRPLQETRLGVPSFLEKEDCLIFFQNSVIQTNRTANSNNIPAKD